MKTLSFPLLSALLLTCAVITATAQQTVDVPRTISYQGLLTSTDGTPLPDGPYDIAVSLFLDEDGTQPLWNAIFNTDVRNGVFNILLGNDRHPLPAPLQMNRPLWVGTAVNGSPLMRPLSPLTASPYALNLPDRTVTTAKLDDGAVTAEKMGTPYVAGIALNGKTITADGSVLNIAVGEGIALTYDEETRTLKLSKTEIEARGDGEKGAEVLGSPLAWDSQGDLTDGTVGGQTTAAGDWIGTSANLGNGTYNFEIRVNNQRTMLYQPNGTNTPNIVGGYSGNTIASSGIGNIIAGGGSLFDAHAIGENSDYNVISGGEENIIGEGRDYSVIAGGEDNTVSESHTVIGGGYLNTANGEFGTIAGGTDNQTDGSYSAIGGGQNNNTVGSHSTISGGQNNVTSVGGSFIGGGHTNRAADRATVGGGSSNRATNFAASIIGGDNNQASGQYSIIGGGQTNVVSADYTTIGGGIENKAESERSFIGGGDANQIPGSVPYSTIGGGNGNKASGTFSTIAGGHHVLASGEGSFIGGGGQSVHIMPPHSGYSHIASGLFSTITGGFIHLASGDYSFVGGGRENTSSGNYSVVSGGQENSAEIAHGFIGGGESNSITVAGAWATISGGKSNMIEDSEGAMIGGGLRNEITPMIVTAANYSTISGGTDNKAHDQLGSIGGGRFNEVHAFNGTIAGGRENTITDPATTATISGGYQNTAEGLESVVAGGSHNTIWPGAYQSNISGGTANNIREGVFGSAISGGIGNNIPSGMLSTIPGGDNIIAQGYGQTALGFFNDYKGTMPFRKVGATLTQLNEPIFMIGNGDTTIGVSARSNAFEVSYNGHSIVYDENGSGGASGTLTPRGAVQGGTYRDNVIYAWADVAANGQLIDGGECADFGVKQIISYGGGRYRVELRVVGPDGITPAVIDCGAVVATVGTGAGPSQGIPTNPGTCYHIMTSSIVNNRFDVFITWDDPNQNHCVAKDAPFKFHVTGRPQ